MKKFARITSVLVFILALIGTIAFWYFVSEGDVFIELYPLIATFIATHFPLVGIVTYEIMRYTGKSFSDLFKKRQK